MLSQPPFEKPGREIHVSWHVFDTCRVIVFFFFFLSMDTSPHCCYEPQHNLKILMNIFVLIQVILIFILHLVFKWILLKTDYNHWYS